LTRTRIAWTAGLALLLLLAVAAVLVVPRLLDEARLRAEAERRLGAALGVPVTIRGPVRFTAGATLEVDVAGVTIAGTTRAPDAPPLAYVERVRASVETASLVGGTLRIGEVRIEGPRLNLQVDAAGRGNWEGLGAGGEDGSPAREWTLAGLVVERAALRYTDARSGADYEVADASLRGGRVELPTPFELTTRLAARSGGAPLATVDLRTQVTADPERGRYAVSALSADARLAREAGPVPVRIGVPSLSYDAAADELHLQPSTLEVLDVRARVEGTARSLSAAPVAEFDVGVEPFDPRRLLQSLAIEVPPMAGPDALSRAALAGHARYAGERLELTQLAATLDDTKLAGRADVVLGTPIRWTLDLTADRLVADRYMKPEKLRDDSPVELPLDALRALHASGQLRVGELVASGVRLRDVVIDLGAEPEGKR
jgi:AsmA protein